MPKCKNCKEIFVAIKSENYCLKSVCLSIWVEKEKEADWKKRKANMKEDLMTIDDYLKLAQKLFNEIIRIRDKNKGCISCKNPPKKFNAGHYHNSKNHPNIRFDLENVHGQCEYCNTSLSGNLINYRKGLVEKIGEQAVFDLDERAIFKRVFTKEELKQMIIDFRIQIKELKLWQEK